MFVKLSCKYRLFLSVVSCFLCNEVLFASSLGELGPLKKSLKFGVVVDNDEFQIYRSKRLGESGLQKLEDFLDDKSLPFPKTVIYMNKSGYKFPFYFSLDEYYLQKSYDFKYYHSFGNPRTYVDGENPFHPSDDIDKNRYLGSKARELFPFRDSKPDGGIKTFYRVLGLVLDRSNQPVLFHCFGGRHRTGMVAMALRYLQGGWWTSGPTKKRMGMVLNPAEYEYYKFNKLFFRKENVKFVRQLSKKEEFLSLVRSYQEALNK